MAKLTTNNAHKSSSQICWSRSQGERVVAFELARSRRGATAEILGANTIAELVALDSTLRTATAIA